MLSETEKRVIISLHLRGCTGSMGSMNRAQRSKLLHGLIDKGMIDNKCNPTKLGLETAKPEYLKNL